MTRSSQKGHNDPPKKEEWKAKEGMKKEQATARGGVYSPGTMMGINWPASITGWFVSLIVGLVLISITSAIFGPIIAKSITLSALGTTAGIIGILILASIIFISYFLGGWIAGKIAGFNGVFHGIMTVVVGYFITFLASILTAIVAGNIAAFLNAAPGPLTSNIAGIVSISGIVLLVIQLVAASLGGFLGERATRMVPAATA